jgi:Xaa-Pro aminopeptidase
MKNHFDSSFFAANRQKLTELFSGTAPIVLTAHGLLQRSNDTTYPFRQDSNFWYLTGLEEPDLVLVLDKGKEYIILPEYSDAHDVFDGAHNIEEMSRLSGIGEFLSEKEGWKRLGGRLSRVQHVATLPALNPYAEGHGFYTNPARSAFIDRLKTHNPTVELLDIRQHFVRMRMIKQDAELSAITDAIDLTARTFNELAKTDLTTYQYEYEVEAYLTAAYRSKGAQHGYEPIVASGKNACTLHYIQNNALVQKGDFLLIDSGAMLDGYTADITRTLAVGEVSRRHQAVYKAVLDVQQYAFSLLKPGVTFKDYEHKVGLYMGEKLRELGLIKVIEEASLRTYYPHATSHYLGLDVHDVADYERALEPGMVLTVEPGIYIPEESIGVRIEDNVVITPVGYDNLSQECTL